MKKFFSILLTVVIALSICACNNGSSSVINQSGKNDKKFTQGEVRNAIAFEPEELIFEDENVKITLLSFAETYSNYPVDPRFEAEFSCKVYNKTASDNIYISVYEMYINDEALGYETGVCPSLKAGKYSIETVGIKKQNPVGTTPESYCVKDLYNLEGIFKIRLNGDYNSAYEVPFSFSNIKKK